MVLAWSEASFDKNVTIIIIIIIIVIIIIII